MSDKFNENLKEARKSAGLTQLGLAKMVGTTKSTISLYESGKREPDILRLKAIAKALGVSCDYLLGIEPPQMDEYYVRLRKRYGAEKVDKYIEALSGLEE